MVTALSPPRNNLLSQAIRFPDLVKRERCRRSLSHFMTEFWDVASQDVLHWNWHIDYMCEELEAVAYRVAEKRPKLYDLVVNVPPGTTKSLTCSIMFPTWCWVNWPWMRFIVSSYSAALSLEHAEVARDLIKSQKFKQIFPDIQIKQDKDTKSNFRIVQIAENGAPIKGGHRYSTSVGGTLTGFHGHILIVDDPLNPKEAVSELKIKAANHWMEQTLSTRKVDKATTPTILIMQRLHQDDPAGHLLNKQKENVRHICLPGQIRDFKQYVRPVEMVNKYGPDGLLDPVRMPWSVMDDLLTDLGQYGFAGQIGQNPSPPGGGMFKVDKFIMTDSLPARVDLLRTIRFWDKAGTQGGKGARTAGVKMSAMKNGKFLIHDCRMGRWGTDEREDVIRETAEIDGESVRIYVEQEPGSGGKESAEASVRNLAGFAVQKDRPTGDKIYRADPYSVQVNHGNIILLKGEWNREFIEEHRFFPFGTFKDQVDAAAGAFNKLNGKRIARRVT